LFLERGGSVNGRLQNCFSLEKMVVRTARLLVHDGVGHDGARSVSRSEKQDVVVSLHLALATFATCGGQRCAATLTAPR
jgi:hypothetical protein